MVNQTSPVPTRVLYPIHEARQLLGNIGHTLFYQLVKDGKIRLTKLRGRSFLTDHEIKRIAGAE